MSWIGHRLVPRLIPAMQHLYEENEEMHSIYFISTGEFAYVLPIHDNAVYFSVLKGTVIGFEDYPYYLSEQNKSFDKLDDLAENRSSVQRKFSVMSAKKAQALELSITDLIDMQKEFPLLVKKLYRDAEKNLVKILMQRVHVN